MKIEVLTILFVFLMGACKRQNCAREFEFHFPATITEGDTFNIGDTLWMRMDLPNELMDYQAGEVIDLSDFNLYFEFGIDRVDTNYVNTATDAFDLVEKVGTFEQDRGRFLVTYIHFKDMADRQFHLGFVAKMKGVYMMAVSLPLEYGLAEEENKLKVIDSPCDYQDITRYSGVIFNNSNINYYLLDSNLCQVSSPNDPLVICLDDSTTLSRRGGYFFIVD